MGLASLFCVELQKVRRSKILLIQIAATVILWLPAILNADLNFTMQAEGISPEHNFFIQGFLAMTWFLYPSVMVVVTVLLNQTERSGNGILKMLSLPVSTVRLCLVKFFVLAAFSIVQFLLSAGMYFLCVGIVSGMQGYDFSLSTWFVMKEVFVMWLTSIPMLAVFWLLAVCIRTPVFSVGIGLASVVPSILLINTRAWLIYPMAYPLFAVRSEYGKLAVNLTIRQFQILPWLPVAASITVFCLLLSCICFGRDVRKGKE